MNRRETQDRVRGSARRKTRGRPRKYAHVDNAVIRSIGQHLQSNSPPPPRARTPRRPETSRRPKTPTAPATSSGLLYSPSLSVSGSSMDLEMPAESESYDEQLGPRLARVLELINASAAASAAASAPRSYTGPYRAPTFYQYNRTCEMKLLSWNVSGIQRFAKNEGMVRLVEENADIVCLQEVGCPQADVPFDIMDIAGYYKYWNVSMSDPQIAGCAIWSRTESIGLRRGMGHARYDQEGRVLTAEFENFYVVCVQAPCANFKAATLSQRLAWNDFFLEYVRELKDHKPVIIAGDLQVAHQEIDVWRPKYRHNNPRFRKEERKAVDHILNSGFVDTFRYFQPDVHFQYTFWSRFGKARAKNVGWRLDYFFVSDNYLHKVLNSTIRTTVPGSLHCPILLYLAI